mmetsp:Transcript_18583/g.51336  ORF Transcript_18583/g.51336 Transcript_18583/m.51336 type:complete len:361 (+) Transcript_18583:417-1499(+)
MRGAHVHEARGLSNAVAGVGEDLLRLLEESTGTKVVAIQHAEEPHLLQAIASARLVSSITAELKGPLQVGHAQIELPIAALRRPDVLHTNRGRANVVELLIEGECLLQELQCHCVFPDGAVREAKTKKDFWVGRAIPGLLGEIEVLNVALDAADVLSQKEVQGAEVLVRRRILGLVALRPPEVQGLLVVLHRQPQLAESKVSQAQVVEALRLAHLIPGLDLDGKASVVAENGLTDFAHLHVRVAKVFIADADAVVILEPLEHVQSLGERLEGSLQLAEMKELESDSNQAPGLARHIADVLLDTQAHRVVSHSPIRATHLAVDIAHVIQDDRLAALHTGILRGEITEQLQRLFHMPDGLVV